MRRTFELLPDVVKPADFAAYDKLAVSPISLHRDRRSHTIAIFLLGEALSAVAVRNFGSDDGLKHVLRFIKKPRSDETL